jgi:hypothetical protein
MNEELEDGDSSALLDGNSRFIEGTEEDLDFLLNWWLPTARRRIETALRRRDVPRQRDVFLGASEPRCRGFFYVYDSPSSAINFVVSAGPSCSIRATVVALL